MKISNYKVEAPKKVKVITKGVIFFSASAIAMLQTSSVVPHEVSDWGMFVFSWVIILAQTYEIFTGVSQHEST